MKESFNKKCRKFILLLKNRKPSRDIRIFDEDVWYNSAYSTVARALGNIKKADGKDYRKWREENFEKMKKMMFENGGCGLAAPQIGELIQLVTIDCIYNEMQRIANTCNVPIGIVQKIVGIMIKYIVANYYGDFCSGTEEKFDSGTVGKKYPWVKDRDFVNTLPIPVDSKVLWSLKELGANLKIKQIGDYAKIDGLAWSRIDIDIYKKIQKEVGRLSGDDGMLGLEMNDLWK